MSFVCFCTENLCKLILFPFLTTLTSALDSLARSPRFSMLYKKYNHHFRSFRCSCTFFIILYHVTVASATICSLCICAFNERQPKLLILLLSLIFPFSIDSSLKTNNLKLSAERAANTKDDTHTHTVGGKLSIRIAQ